MTLPAYVSNGGLNETAVPWPGGHAVGQCGILLVENDVDTVSNPTGFTLVATSSLQTGNNTVLQAWRRFATSTSEPAASISASNHCSGVILTFSGVNTANPIHSLAKHANLSGTADRICPGATTYLPDCYVLACFSWHADNAGPLSSGETNADLASLVELFDGGTTSGNGGGLVAIGGTKVVEGVIGPTTVTFSASAATATICIALQAADRTYGHRARYTMTGM